LNNRTTQFRRNTFLEQLLSELAADLQTAEERLAKSYRNQDSLFPVVLVMGPLRSGTTLFMQWLANTGVVAYPTNLLSRFYYAPIIGAKIQLLLTDPRYRFRDELNELQGSVAYVSENGKTGGILAPNEFWYFWRRFLAEPSRDVWSDTELARGLDVQDLRAELNGLMAVFQKPFATKGMLFNYNIPFLDSVLEKVLFVQIKRDPAATVASVLEARTRQLGSQDKWYSFLIPEYPVLKDLPPIEQVAGQVYFTTKAVSEGLSTVDESRKLVVDYESFCREPRRCFELKTRKLALNIEPTSYRGPKSFQVTRTEAEPNRDAILRALHAFTV
jgi:hypothetical protein